MMENVNPRKVVLQVLWELENSNCSQPLNNRGTCFSIIFYFDLSPKSVASIVIRLSFSPAFKWGDLPFGGLNRVSSALQKSVEEWLQRHFFFNFFQKSFLLWVGNLKISHYHHKIQFFTGFQKSYRSLESRGNMQDLSRARSGLTSNLDRL